MKRKIFAGGLLLFALVGQAQITIEECYRKAQENYPLIKQYDLIEKTKEYNLANASRGYLPQVMLSAKATYQSDVTKMPFDLAQLGMQGIKIPTLSKDQYGVTLEINQTIWDGGEISSQRAIARTGSAVEEKKVEVNVYSINDRVNRIYFGILLTDARIEQNRLLKKELQRNYDRVYSCMLGGIANSSDLDAVRVDQLKAEQNEAALLCTKQAYVEMLSQLIGEEIDATAEFVKPSIMRPSTDAINRPELELYDMQVKNFEAENRRVSSALYPRFGLFITGGYGRPGLDMLKNEFSPYYLAGVRMSWNIGSFYTEKNRRRVIRNNIQSVEAQRETFLFNTRLDIAMKDKSIEKYVEQLKYDDEIIRLKTSIREASEKKMENGTLSGTDLMRDVNAEQMAIQDKILHEMELLSAIYDLKFATNN
mgnify:FL=1